ncbi:MAG TPA: RsmE family RNA methyltransferase [Spirochaetota bacterium]|nr:RsmE family RNA methyltransferase [Spirochaetota bacterium]
MKKIFILDEVFKKGTVVTVEGDIHRHISSVLRSKPGETFVVGDKENNEFIGVVERVKNDHTVILLRDFYYREEFHYPETILFFAVLKGDKNEEIIQRCTEIGADIFVPVIAEKTIVKIDSDTAAKKIIKWQKTAKEAASQCGRLKIPHICPIIKFNEVEKFSSGSLKITASLEKTSKSFINLLNDNKNFDKISLFAGPEGDFSKKELDTLRDNGWNKVKLANNVLRSETACFFMISSLFFYYGRGI